jgi:hypothetical protein
MLIEYTLICTYCSSFRMMFLCIGATVIESFIRLFPTNTGPRGFRGLPALCMSPSRQVEVADDGMNMARLIGAV